MTAAARARVRRRQGRDRRLPLLYSPAARFLEHRV
jgi:hypothetical protein